MERRGAFDSTELMIMRDAGSNALLILIFTLGVGLGVAVTYVPCWLRLEILRRKIKRLETNIKLRN